MTCERPKAMRCVAMFCALVLAQAVHPAGAFLGDDGSYQSYAGDFNGDGIADVWMTGFDGAFFCPGPGIVSANNCAKVWHDDWRSLYEIHTGDFNGDGITDIWMTGFNGAFFCRGPGIASAN